MHKRGNRGFTLLELLIVVSIILILAVIATPSFISALQSSRETSAVATLRQIYSAEMLYASSNNTFGSFEGLVAVGGLDDRFLGGNGTPTLGGYTYSIIIPDDDSSGFVIQAEPVTLTSGRYDYYTGLDGVVRYLSNLGDAVPGSDVR